MRVPFLIHDFIRSCIVLDDKFIGNSVYFRYSVRCKLLSSWYDVRFVSVKIELKKIERKQISMKRVRKTSLKLTDLSEKDSCVVFIIYETRSNRRFCTLRAELFEPIIQFRKDRLNGIFVNSNKLRNYLLYLHFIVIVYIYSIDIGSNTRAFLAASLPFFFLFHKFSALIDCDAPFRK